MAEGSRSSFAGAMQRNTLPAWARWLMPSVADLIFLGLLGALAFTNLSTRLLNDAGTGWHIRTGQQILANHALPRLDPFSSTMGGKSWIAWEWLYDVIVGRLESGLELNGVIWFTAVVIAAAFAWTFQMMMARGTNLLIALGLVLLAISASMIHFLARPHVLTWLFTVAWFNVLDSAEQDALAGKGGSRNRRLWMLPLSMVLWANVHGGFLIGFVLLAIFWLRSLWGWASTKENRLEDSIQRITFGKQFQDLTWVGLLIAAASLINPFGWRLHQHIISYLSNRFLMDHIEEFQSPDFHGVAQRCFLVLLAVAFAGIAVSGRKLALTSFLLILFAMCSGLYASRNIPVSSLLLALSAGPLIPSPRKPVFFQRMNVMDRKLRGHLWPVLATAVVFFIAVNHGRMGSQLVLDAHFSPYRMPVQAVDYLAKKGAPQTILSPDYWGGYLIYRLYPNTKVVMDDRHDLYGEQILQSYLKMARVGPGWNEFLLKNEVGVVMWPKGTALPSMLGETRGWKTIYMDDMTVILQRTK